MKKPELSDFNLNENLVAKLQKQEEDYNIKYNNQKQEIATFNVRVNYVIGFIIVISFFIFIILAIENEKEGLFFLWILLSIVMIFIANKCIKKNISNYTISDKRLYVDINAAQQYQNYCNALKEYQEYIELNQRAFWESMSGYEFEKAVANLYSQMGYNTQLTPYSKDGGVDIVLTKDDDKIAVQCKHHKNPVGPHDVRALIGSITINNYSKGIFISLNGFTSGAYAEKRSSPVDIEFLDIVSLLKFSKDLAEEKFPDKRTNDTKEKTDDPDLIKYIGAIVYYDKYGYGAGHITDINNEYITIKFVPKNKEPFVSNFTTDSLGKTIKIIQLDEELGEIDAGDNNYELYQNLDDFFEDDEDEQRLPIKMFDKTETNAKTLKTTQPPNTTNNSQIIEKQSFYYNTHAELLNYLLNKNYKAWMKSWYILNGSHAIWVIALDYQVRSGWRNRRDGDTIYENYVGKTINRDPLNYRNRLCFSIHNNGWQRIYIFEGVFKYIKTENNTRIWQKISDTYTFLHIFF